ncbi:MAG: type III pantothenate kinase [Deferribacteres bacterium]|nr:type III pantothenate kinase [Deferribacteres bacterium]
MLLLIDIGNSDITIGLCENESVQHTLRLGTLMAAEDAGMFSRLLRDFIRDNGMQQPRGAAICSVVPGVTPLLTGALQREFDIEPLIVTHRLKTGLRFSVKNINGLGADRIAGAAAARRLYTGDLVVVDFGTATTFNVVTQAGEYMGGAIMPGPGLSADSLAGKTAKLPRVDLNGPVRIPGRDTAENIRAGVILGHAGAVERIISEMENELKTDLSLIATGGFSRLITPYMKIDPVDINPLLTLQGLRFIYEMNSGVLSKNASVREAINSGG